MTGFIQRFSTQKENPSGGFGEKDGRDHTRDDTDEQDCRKNFDEAEKR
jgi:hypothetical protein